jgi:hypothetical protein
MPVHQASKLDVSKIFMLQVLAEDYQQNPNTLN